MYYVKNLLFYCAIVFFANYLLPGIDVVNQTKLPHVKGDLIFAGALGLLNFCIAFLGGRSFPIVRAIIAIFILNFAIYAVLKLFHLGIFTTSVEGYLLGAGVVSLGCSILAYVQGKRVAKKEHAHASHTHHHHETHDSQDHLGE